MELIETGINCLHTTKCTHCQTEIGTNTNNVFIVGGWPFCKMSCVEDNQVRIAWNRRHYNHNILHFGEAKLQDFQCMTKGPRMEPVDEEFR